MRKYYPVPGLQGGGRKIGGGQPSGYLSFESSKELKRKSILPLIRLGYVAMIYPARQTYKLTEKGKTLF